MNLQLIVFCISRALEMRRSAHAQQDLELRANLAHARKEEPLMQCNGGVDEFERFLNGPFQR